MADSNAFLQTIVTDAKTVCQNKFNLAKTVVDPNNDDLKKLKKDMDRIFSTMAKPGFWNASVDADGTQVVVRVISLGKTDGTQPDKLLKNIGGLLQALEVTILQPAQDTTVQTKLPSDMNTQALNALRMTRQQIAMRVQKFAQNNQDISQDPDYKTRQQKQDTLVATYREKLLNNLISSKQTDVKVLKQSGVTISGTLSKTAFFSAYDNLTNFIQLKVGTA